MEGKVDHEKVIILFNSPGSCRTTQAQGNCSTTIRTGDNYIMFTINNLGRKEVSEGMIKNNNRKSRDKAAFGEAYASSRLPTAKSSCNFLAMIKLERKDERLNIRLIKT